MRFKALNSSLVSLTEFIFRLLRAVAHDQLPALISALLSLISARRSRSAKRIPRGAVRGLCGAANSALDVFRDADTPRRGARLVHC